MEIMSYRGPYRDLETNSDPYSDPYELTDRDPRIIRIRDGRLSTGSIIGAFIAIVVIAAAMVYAINRNATTTTATGPDTATSAPSTSGQGGAAGTGNAR
jgi:hypothetical protein